MNSKDGPSELRGGPGVSPYDTNASSGFRFLIEIVAWVAGPWAIADVTGSGWLAVPTLLVLFGLPALFNTPGDKASTVVATPGLLRILIEMVLLTAAVAGAWIVWPPWAAVIVSGIGLAMLITGGRRYRWLAAIGTRVD
jgi:hypothetical protein